MSTTTNEIIEKLKSITLLEAAELVSQIEETFGVDASAPVGWWFCWLLQCDGAGGRTRSSRRKNYF